MEQNPGARIAGLYDLNQERAQALAAQYGAKAYESYEALLADPAIDAVSVCSANVSHAEIAVAALAAGKHVLCEKPMATTLEDCERMVAAAQKSGKYLMIDQNQRLAGAHRKARELIRAGAIGKPLTSARRSATAGRRHGAWTPARAPGSLTRSARPWAPWRTWACTRPT